jgi:uncharacterized iron-regulated membrane protein
LSFDTVATTAQGKARPSRIIYAIHSWTGLIAGWLLFVICLTGTLVVYKFPLKAIANPAFLNASADRIGADGALARVRAARPDERVKVVAFPSDIYSIHQYSVVTEQANGKEHRYWVSPQTGVIRTSLQSDFADFVQRLHAQLFLGATGRWVVGVLGILMAVSAGTGLAFHWRRLRRDLFVLAPRAHPRKAWSSVHKFGGVWGLPFHLLIALTGAWLGLESLIGIRASSAAPLVIEGEGAGTPLPIAEIVRRARSARPDFTPTHVNFASYGAAGSTVRVQGDLPGYRLVQRGQTRLVFDADSGRLLQTIDRTTQGAGRRVLAMMRPLHYGYFWPGFSELLYFLLGAASTILCLSGMLIWAERDKKARAPRGAAGRASGMERANAGIMGGLLLALPAMACTRRRRRARGRLRVRRQPGPARQQGAGARTAPVPAAVGGGRRVARRDPPRSGLAGGDRLRRAHSLSILPLLAIAAADPLAGFGRRGGGFGDAGYAATCWGLAVFLALLAHHLRRRDRTARPISKRVSG